MQREIFMTYPSAPDGLVELFEAYERGPDDLAAHVKGMTSDQFRARPIAGKWSTLEVLCHLSDSEQVLSDRIKRTIAMDKPLLMGYDEGRYSGALAYHDRDPAEELSLIRVTRSQVMRIIRSLEPSVLDRTGIHSERGLVTAKQFVQLAVGHMVHHLAFVHDKRKAMSM